MKLVALKIRPKSFFGTNPKGDTLFGQIVAEFFMSKDNTFSDYLDYLEKSCSPKLIVSDMMPYGYLPKPTLPIDCFGKNIDKKVLRKNKFISVRNLQNGDLDKSESVEFITEITTIKNSINRVSFSTAEGDFAPYGLVEKSIKKELWMFVLVDEALEDKVINTIRKIGKFGFGKDTSIGKGNFDVEVIDFKFDFFESEYFMSISPVIAKEDKNIQQVWYEPIVRFGKYGYHWADSKAFKKPVLMCETGAVVKLKEKREYFGSAINNGFSDKPSFLQGYSIAVPIKIKDERCLGIK